MPAPTLTEIAARLRTDKWGGHFYTPHYERHLGHLRRREFTLLEIGIGGYDRKRGGASLKMWKRFFRRAQIVGLEIPIARLIGKTKASQNRREVDREGAIAGLRETGDHGDIAMAAIMDEVRRRPKSAPL